MRLTNQEIKINNLYVHGKERQQVKGHWSGTKESLNVQNYNIPSKNPWLLQPQGQIETSRDRAGILKPWKKGLIVKAAADFMHQEWNVITYLSSHVGSCNLSSIRIIIYLAAVAQELLIHHRWENILRVSRLWPFLS